MRAVSEAELAAALGRLGDKPRLVASGNAAAPRELIRLASDVLPSWRLHMLNAPPDLPVGDGVRLETAFVGAGMRDDPRLEYIPARLSLVPLLFRGSRAPDGWSGVARVRGERPPLRDRGRTRSRRPRRRPAQPADAVHAWRR
jgi:hypothetical protein